MHDDLMQLSDAGLVCYIFKEAFATFVLELLVHIPSSICTFICTRFTVVMSSVQHKCTVFWRAPGLKAKGLLIMDSTSQYSQLAWQFMTVWTKTVGTPVRAGIGRLATLAANTVVPMLWSTWQAARPVLVVAGEHIARQASKCLRSVITTTSSAWRWTVTAAAAVTAAVANACTPANDVKLSDKVTSSEAAAASVLPSEPLSKGTVPSKHAQHDDENDRQSDLLKAHRSDFIQTASKEPLSATQVQAGAGHDQPSAVRDQVQTEPGHKQPSTVPDQALHDTSKPVLNNRARKQLRKASQAALAAADVTPGCDNGALKPEGQSDMAAALEGEGSESKSSAEAAVREPQTGQPNLSLVLHIVMTLPLCLTHTHLCFQLSCPQCLVVARISVQHTASFLERAYAQMQHTLE